MQQCPMFNARGMKMRKKMTKVKAAKALIYEAMRERNTKTGYYRAVNAMLALQIPSDAMSAALYAMNYTNEKGQPHEWLTRRRAA